MRVLHLTRDFPPRATGGISTAVGGLVAALAAAGVESQVVSFDAWRPLAGTPGDSVPSEERRGPVSVLRVRSAAAAEAALARAAAAQPDIVHVHDGLLWPWTERLAGRCPRLLTAHVLHHQLNRARGLTAPTLSSTAQEAALAAADAVVAPSRAALAGLVAVWPDLAARAVTIGLGVSPVVAPAGRSEPPLVLVVGRFADVKGSGEVVAAIPLLFAGHPRVEVAVIGGNPESPRSDRRWRQRLAAAGAASPGRLHLPGWLGPDEVAHWQDRAWVQLCPSWCETFGLAAAEAMARGVAVVATEVGALAELVADGETGRLVPVRDAAALAAATLALVAAPATAAALGRAGHARVAARHRWPEVAREHLALYRRVGGGGER